MKPVIRSILCFAILLIGLGAQAALERMNQIERPSLREALSSLPMAFDEWVGCDEPVATDVVQRAQTTQYLNRIYQSRTQPGLRFTLWVNFSEKGTNLRHTPEICLPSSGWTKIESQTKVLIIQAPNAKELSLTRLSYAQSELVEQVGFWYYIFGEGRLEKLIRHLPITSRSSHGRTTRGSSMTVEIFSPGEFDPDGDALRRFACSLVDQLEPILPANRAEYYIP